MSDALEKASEQPALNRGLLRYAADRRTLAFVAVCYAFTYGGYFAWHAGLLAVPWWALLPWIAFAAVLSFSVAVITHNTIHAPIFYNRNLNRLFQIALTLGYGHPVSAYVPGHNLSHHLYAQSRRDVMRTTKLRFRWNLLNQLFFMPVVAKSITRSDFDFAVAMYKERPRWFQQWVIEWIAMIVMTVTLLLLDWRAFLMFVLVPHTFAAWGIVGINFVQHDGCDPSHPFNHSRNLVGPWMNWWFFNNGYHGIHHDEAALHWSLTPSVHAKKYHGNVHPNLEVPDFAVYCWKAYISPGQRVDYLGKPVVLPEEGPDESWIPGRSDTPKNVSLGAES